MHVAACTCRSAAVPPDPQRFSFWIETIASMDNIHFFFLACKNTTLQDELNVALCCPCCSHLDNHATNAELLTLQLILCCCVAGFPAADRVVYFVVSAPVNMYPNVSVTAQKKKTSC